MGDLRLLGAEGRTYKQETYCRNCNNIFTIEVPMGKLLCHQSYVCTKCGCTKEQVEEERLKQQAELQRQGVMPSGAQLNGPQ